MPKKKFSGRKPATSKISKPPYGKTHRSGTAKNTWNDVIDRWDLKHNDREAWRHADSSLIPEYVPPFASLNDLMKKSVDSDAEKFRKKLARIADVSKGSHGRRA